MGSRWLRLVACAAALLAPALGGCGSSGLDGHVYQGDGFAFRIAEPPASWKPLEVSHAALSFRDDQSAATIAINARCGADADDVPLTALTQHLFLGMTDREITSQEVVAFDGREAQHTVLSAKLDGVPKRFDVWVLKKDGCVFDLLLIADGATFPSAQATFLPFVRGFSVLRGAVDVEGGS